MVSNPKDLRRAWRRACLAFTAAALFMFASAFGPDPYHVRLILGLLNWGLGFRLLWSLKPPAAAQRAAADDECRQAGARA